MRRTGNPFRNRAAAFRLSPEEAERQGRVSRLAFDTLGAAEAIAFLNGHDDALGGRPLDLAVRSEAGIAAVAQALADRKH